MGTVLEFPHSAASRTGKKASRGKPVATLNRAAILKEGSRQPVSMRETVATVVSAADATSCCDNPLDSRCARSGCIVPFLPRWKDNCQTKLSITDKDAQAIETYAFPMVERIGPTKPRQRAYLYEWREHRGWTQAHLAGLMDTTDATISRYETGARGYPGGYLARFAEVMGCDEGDLYRLPEPVSEAQETVPSLDSMVRDSPPAIQQLARTIITALVTTGSVPSAPPIRERKRAKK